MIESTDCQYAYNNSVHATMRQSLFQVMFGEDFQWKDMIQDNKDIKVPLVWKQALNVTVMKQKLEIWVKKAIEAQAKYYNTKHKQQKYNVGDMVFFNSQNIKSTWSFKKLDLKYYSPYKSIAPIGKQAYWLTLTSSMKIHNIFHVLLLELYDTKGKTPPIFSIDVEGEKEYEVKEILDSCIHYGKLQYLVKWLGYLHMDNQWAEFKDIFGALELVSIYHSLYLDKFNAMSPKKGSNLQSKWLLWNVNKSDTTTYSSQKYSF